MKQSEVTRLVRQWQGVFPFTFIFESYFTSILFHFFSLTSSSLSLAGVKMYAGVQVEKEGGGGGEKSIARVFEVF